MKRFFLMVLLVSVFFTGLGGMLDETAAKLKSDDKALAILQKARQAIGGDNNIAAVGSMVVTGKSTRTLRFDGTMEKTLQGDMELALQFPDKMMKSVKMSHDNGSGSGSGEKVVDHQMDVVIVRDGEVNAKWKAIHDGEMKPGEGKKIIIKKDDGTTEEIQPGKNVTFTAERVAKDMHEDIRAGGGKQMTFHRMAQGAEASNGEFPWQLRMARTALSLLLTAPQGMDVSYLYGGEENVDGTVCNIINAQVGGGTIKLYIGRDSNLPVMMAYTDAKPMVFQFRMHHDGEGDKIAGDKEVKVFDRHPAPPETAEFQVKFSDYRNVNGVLLPYKWTQTMGGQTDEVIDVTGYEINPANIAEKFKGNGETKVFMRKAKEQ